jgi:hypothetical protein
LQDKLTASLDFMNERIVKETPESKQLAFIRAIHNRLKAFHANLQGKLKAFLAKPSAETFDALITTSKRYNFDSIKFLSKEFVWDTDAQTGALAQFFGALAETPANKAWVVAIKPVVDAAKKELDAAGQRAVHHAVRVQYA